MPYGIIFNAYGAVSLLHNIAKVQQNLVFQTTINHYTSNEGSIPFTRAGSSGGKEIRAAHYSLLRRNEKRKHRSHLKDEGAFQQKEFFALGPCENNWQIDAMNAKRKFQVFVIPPLVRWFSRAGNGVGLTAGAANCHPANDSHLNEPGAGLLSRPVCLGCF